jgi:hypothetical protein
MAFENYSPRKFNSAERAELDEAELEALNKYRDTARRWREARLENQQTPKTTVGFFLAAFREAREVFRSEQIRYQHGKGRGEHMELEKASAATKAGQLELAQEEASFFNDAFDVRAARLSEAEKNRETAPEEYNAALESFDELIRDLNEGDLRKYHQSLFIKRLNQDSFGPSVAKDVIPNTRMKHGK